MPRFFAAKPMTVGDRQVAIGDEIDAAGWRNLDTWIGVGAIVVSLDPEEIVSALKQAGGAPGWLRRQSADVVLAAEAARAVGQMATPEPVDAPLPAEISGEGRVSAEPPVSPPAANEDALLAAEMVLLKATDVIEFIVDGVPTAAQLDALLEAELAGKARTTVLDAIERAQAEGITDDEDSTDGGE